jgi:GT2 family glycosyltransferase
MKKYIPWQILHLDLSQDLPTLPLKPDCQGIFVVFWWRNLALGHQKIPAAQLPMPVTQLANLAVQAMTPAVGDRLFKHGFKADLPIVSQNPARDLPPNFHALMALDRPLNCLDERYSQLVSSTSNSVSVVICTRNRPEQLSRCLKSLQNLSQQPQEIIVVDNAPDSDATRQLVAQMPGIKYVLEPRPGLSVARNTGIRHCHGDIVAFTDDDVVVHPNWIAHLEWGFQVPEVMAVTGLILPAALETEAQLIFQEGFAGFGWGYHSLTFDTQFFKEMQYRGVPVWHIGAGANMAFRRQVFELVGYFDERLGAGASGCSEDSELWYRVLAEGWLCRYEPASIVYHYHRSDLDSLKQQSYQYMRGHVAALLVQFARYKHWGNLRRLFVALPRYYSEQLARGLRKGFQQQYSTLPAEISGCLSGMKYYLDNRSIAPFTSSPTLTTNPNTLSKSLERQEAKS